MDMVAMFCDNILIGEELYAASASITRDKIAIATIAGQDWVKIIVLCILLLGIGFILAGSKAIWQILGT